MQDLDEYKLCKVCLSYFEASEYEDHLDAYQTNQTENEISLEGAICFSAFNFSKNLLKRIGVNKAFKTDSRYLLIKQGLNLLSKCRNLDCGSKLKNYRVYNQLGLTYIVIPDIYDGNLKCLECESVLEIEDFITITFCDCKYKWKGKEKMKQNDKFITKIHKFGEWQIVSGVKKFIDNDKDFKWYNLEFKVKKNSKLIK